MSADSTAPGHHPAPNDPPKLDDATRALVRAKARQIVRGAGFVPTDADDLEQDIAVHVWTRLERYDRSKADRAVFVRMLVGHAAATALRDRTRRVRRAPPALARALWDGDAHAEPVDPRAARREAATALALDVADVLDALPRKLRRVAEALKTHSVAAAARHLGVSRAAVYATLKELRRAFEDAGLAESAARRRTPRRRAE
jgi:RNA polymerase sigma factor (sigma-70 family)